MTPSTALIPFSDLQKLARCTEALSVLIWLVENSSGDCTVKASIRDIAAGTGMTKHQVCKGLDFLKANRTSNKCPRFDGFSPLPTLVSDNIGDIPKGCKSTIITLNAITSYDELLNINFKQKTEIHGHSEQNVRQSEEKPPRETPTTALDIKQPSRQRATKSSLSLPYTSEKFVSVWKLLLEQPKWKKKTVHALELNLKDLAQYPEDFAIHLMEDAIKKGTQGIVYDWTPENYQKWLASTSSNTLSENSNRAGYQHFGNMGGFPAKTSPSRLESSIEAGRQASAIIDRLFEGAETNENNIPDEQ